MEDNLSYFRAERQRVRIVQPQEAHARDSFRKATERAGIAQGLPNGTSVPWCSVQC